MKYELWANEDKTSLSLFGVEYPNYEQNLQLIKDEGDCSLIRVFEAENYNEAMQKYYDYMDWGKYKPIDE